MLTNLEREQLMQRALENVGDLTRRHSLLSTPTDSSDIISEIYKTVSIALRSLERGVDLKALPLFRPQPTPPTNPATLIELGKLS